ATSMSPTTTTTVLEITVTRSIRGGQSSAPTTESIDCPYSDNTTSMLCTVITIYHHIPIPTLVTFSPPILTLPKDWWPGAATGVVGGGRKGAVQAEAVEGYEEAEEVVEYEGNMESRSDVAEEAGQGDKVKNDKGLDDEDQNGRRHVGTDRI
ncbi:hypothetical protein QBC42DRAFT_276870, partial [Cladorrhinum samala]